MDNFIFLDWDKCNYGYILRNWQMIEAEFRNFILEEDEPSELFYDTQKEFTSYKDNEIKIFQGQGGLNVALELGTDTLDLTNKYDFDKYIKFSLFMGSDLFRIRHEIEKFSKSEFSRINRFWIDKNGFTKKLIFHFNLDNVNQLSNLRNYIQSLGVDTNE